ncbi:MAG: hypothetical protein Q9190_000852 [Brigantiaea leucoxantha]
MASDGVVDLVAIMTPKPGKMDRCLEILEQATHLVREYEPGALRYHMFVEMEGDQRGKDVVWIEQYENQAAWEAHTNGKAYEFMSKIMPEEDILATAPVLKFLKPMAGWASK